MNTSFEYFNFCYDDKNAQVTKIKEKINWNFNIENRKFK